MPQSRHIFAVGFLAICSLFMSSEILLSIDNNRQITFAPSKKPISVCSGTPTVESFDDCTTFATNVLETLLSTKELGFWMHAIKAYQKLKGNLTTQEQNVIATFATNMADREGEPWNDFDWSVYPANCGYFKCFWPSKSNSSTGYLVFRGKTPKKFNLEAFEDEHDLVNRFGIPQLILEPPRKARNISSDMNDLLWAYGNDQTVNPVYTQRRIRVPEPNLLIGANGPKPMSVRLGIPEFSKLITNISDFQHQFRIEIQCLDNILKDPVHQDLMRDFQLLLAPNGRFYHIDVDRAAEARHEVEHGHRKRNYNRTKYMETMERVLFWMTEANGNFSGLHDEILFERGYEKQYEKMFTTEPKVFARHDDVLIKSLLKAIKKEKKDEMTEELQATMATVATAIASREGRPWCHDDVLLKSLLKGIKKEKKDEITEELQATMTTVATAIASREGRPWCDIDWSFGFVDEKQACDDKICQYSSLSDPSIQYNISRNPMLEENNGDHSLTSQQQHLSKHMRDLLRACGHFEHKMPSTTVVEWSRMSMKS